MSWSHLPFNFRLRDVERRETALPTRREKRDFLFRREKIQWYTIIETPFTPLDIHGDIKWFPRNAVRRERERESSAGDIRGEKRSWVTAIKRVEDEEAQHSKETYCLYLPLLFDVASAAGNWREWHGKIYQIFLIFPTRATNTRPEIACSNLRAIT